MHLLKHCTKTLLFLVALVSLAPFTVMNGQADELAIPVGQQGADKSSLDRPKTGMKADAVEKKFGAPLNKSTPVGKPPISRWEYPYYNVYFESDRVLHTVMKPVGEETTPVAEPVPASAPAAEAAPAAAPIAEVVSADKPSPEDKRPSPEDNPSPEDKRPSPEDKPSPEDTAAQDQEDKADAASKKTDDEDKNDPEDEKSADKTK